MELCSRGGGQEDRRNFLTGLSVAAAMMGAWTTAS
ncbi:twin-arginine translocation signal domain-containing protein [Streptomyces sp. NPDC007205]